MTMQNLESPQIFRNIEKTGEIFKQQFQALVQKAQRIMDSQINSAKFEAAYALSVSKKQRATTMSQVKQVRDELWTQALKKANGNTKNASIFYEEFCDFP